MNNYLLIYNRLNNRQLNPKFKINCDTIIWNWNTIYEPLDYDTVCPITLNTIDEFAKYCKCTVCRNVYDADTIHKWLLNNKTTCPLCRSKWKNYNMYQNMNNVKLICQNVIKERLQKISQMEEIYNVKQQWTKLIEDALNDEHTVMCELLLANVCNIDWTKLRETKYESSTIVKQKLLFKIKTSQNKRKQPKSKN